MLGFLKAKSAGKPYEIHSINLNFTSANLNDASWKTATGMGTLSYMEYGRVQQFASAYQEQELFTRIELETIDN